MARFQRGATAGSEYIGRGPEFRADWFGLAVLYPCRAEVVGNDVMTR